MQSKIAPHEGRELEFVTVGIKPLASIEKSKQPEQYDRAFKLQNVLSVRQHDNDLITVTRKENSHLHDVFTLLSSSKASVVVRSQRENHVLLGRLFGYTEDEIFSFLEAGLECACGQCRWDSDVCQ